MPHPASLGRRPRRWDPLPPFRDHPSNPPTLRQCSNSALSPACCLVVSVETSRIAIVFDSRNESFSREALLRRESCEFLNTGPRCCCIAGFGATCVRSVRRFGNLWLWLALDEWMKMNGFRKTSKRLEGWFECVDFCSWMNYREIVRLDRFLDGSRCWVFRIVDS